MNRTLLSRSDKKSERTLIESIRGRYYDRTGLIEEVRNLLNSGYSEDLVSFKG